MLLSVAGFVFVAIMFYYLNILQFIHSTIGGYLDYF